MQPSSELARAYHPGLVSHQSWQALETCCLNELLQQAEAGGKTAEICRKLGISQATFYNWRKQYAGLGVQQLRELRQGLIVRTKQRKKIARRQRVPQLLATRPTNAGRWIS